MQWERTLASVVLEEDGALEGVDVRDQTLNDVRIAAVAVIEGRDDKYWNEKLHLIATTIHNRMKDASSSLELNTFRKIYTDASILRGLLQSLLFSPNDSIAILDKAIIIAGPYGSGRLDFILDLIRRIQRPLLSNWRIRSDTKISPPSQVKPELSECTIPCLPTVPSFIAFQLTYSRQPFILRNYAADWPALLSRPWGSYSYLLSVAGPGRMVPVEVGHDYRSDEWRQKIMLWEDFLALLEFKDHSAATSGTDIFYMAQHNLIKQFPDLLEDIIIPDYVYADLRSSDFPSYDPLHNETQMLVNTWLGPKGTLSPAHTDPYFNFYVQIVGHKSVWLAPTDVSDSMYTFSSASSSDSVEGPSSQLTNTSRVDVFSNPRDLTEFPDFAAKVIPHSMRATLGPGDALFFPPGWWHSMRSESTSLSLSMWF